MTDMYEYIDTTGVIVPDTSSILSAVQSQYQAAFGSDLIVTADTPQGVLINAETTILTAMVNNNAALANQINPNLAGGAFLDAIMQLTGMQRTAATQTVVTGVTLTGVSSTVVPQGSQAQTAAGDIFATTEAVTIVGGTATADFASVVYGAIPCAVSALTTIVSSVLGWETVTNPTAGVLGTATQSDQKTRVLRDNTLAFQGVALPVAITSALYAVPGVTSLSFLENISYLTQTIDTISMLPHSIYACVEGGTNTDVAAALLENKSSGCNWNGSTTVDLVEPVSGQTYAVSFDRPTGIGILIKVATSNGNSTNIQNAILNYAAGGVVGFAGFVVGSNVSPFEIMAGLAAQYPQYYISNVQISLVSPVSYTNTPITINPNQIAQTQLTYITVVIT